MSTPRQTDTETAPTPVTHDSTSEAAIRPTTERERRPVLPLTHGKCGTTWTGARTAHCSGCCRTFSGVTLFDAHRKVAGEHGQCLDPAEMRDKSGALIAELRDGVWSFPEMTDAEKAAAFGREDGAA